MLRRDMALGANPRIGNLEEPVVHRAMRFMTVSTVLHDRRVLPQKWPAPFRVTGVTIFVNAALFQLGRIRAAMGIVTIGAGHLSFSHWHMR